MTLTDWLTYALWIAIWIIAGLGIWLGLGVGAGILIGRGIRGRNHHHPRVCGHGHPEAKRWSGCDGAECWYGHPIPGRSRTTPSPNHPAVRAHKQLADRPPDPGPPLTPRETAALDQLREQLR